MLIKKFEIIISIYYSMAQLFLANFIYALHLVLVLFMVIAPFTSSLSLLILHVSFSASLMFHWYANSNACCLSLAEAYLRGTTVDKTFLNRVIEPVYVISENRMNHIIWASTIVLALVSLYRIYNHPNLPKLMTCTSFVECAMYLR